MTETHDHRITMTVRDCLQSGWWGAYAWGFVTPVAIALVLAALRAWGPEVLTRCRARRGEGTCGRVSPVEAGPGGTSSAVVVDSTVSHSSFYTCAGPLSLINSELKSH